MTYTIQKPGVTSNFNHGTIALNDRVAHIKSALDVLSA
jgi:hypothetical protein